jgi:hypothetical protein
MIGEAPIECPRSCRGWTISVIVRASVVEDPVQLSPDTLWVPGIYV